MKKRFVLSAGLVLLTGVGLAFAAPDVKTAAAAAAPAVKQESPKVREFKDILFKLVRQDEYLDEAIETLDSSNGKMSLQDISAMSLSLKTITNNLSHVSALNKGEFASIQAGSELSTYTNTILSYSRKVDRKAGQVNVLVAQLAARSKKASLRDAVSSRKGGKKVRGKKISQIIDEQKAMDALTAGVKALRGASRGLNATSKWLYIASK